MFTSMAFVTTLLEIVVEMVPPAAEPVIMPVKVIVGSWEGVRDEAIEVCKFAKVIA
jgi:hypothetical protein